MYRVMEKNILRPRGFNWKRTFKTREEAEAAIDRFFRRNPLTRCELRIHFER